MSGALFVLLVAVVLGALLRCMGPRPRDVPGCFRCELDRLPPEKKVGLYLSMLLEGILLRGLADANCPPYLRLDVRVTPEVARNMEEEGARIVRHLRRDTNMSGLSGGLPMAHHAYWYGQRQRFRQAHQLDRPAWRDRTAALRLKVRARGAGQ